MNAPGKALKTNVPAIRAADVPILTAQEFIEIQDVAV